MEKFYFNKTNGKRTLSNLLMRKQVYQQNMLKLLNGYLYVYNSYITNLHAININHVTNKNK